jgi:hypothetical protein
MVMKVVNDKNLSVEQLIMALAEREQVLYAMYQDMEKWSGSGSYETNCAFNQWNSVYEFMQYMIIGVEDTESVGSVEI